MDERFMAEFIKHTPYAYAYHKLLLNDQGEPEDYVFLEVNPAFEEITGLNREKILGKRVTEVLPGVRTGSYDWVSTYGKIVLTGEKQEFNQYVDFLGRWFKICAFSTQKQHFVTIFQDITSEMVRLRTLNNQKKEIERLSMDLETIFNSTHNAMFLVGLKQGEFRYIRTNLAHQNLTGFKLSEIISKSPVELFGQVIGKTLIENYSRCIEAKRQITCEDSLPYPSGQRIWSTTLSPVFEEGEIKYIVGSKEDITNKKRVESERESLLQQLMSMFNDHTAVMLLIEPVTGKIISANPAAISFYGYSREEILNMNIHDINRLSEAEVERRRLLALNKGQGYFVFPHRLKSGEIRLVDVYSCPVVYQGQNHLFSIIFDVTDRERYKEELTNEKERLNITLYSIGDAVITTDNEAKITAMNKVAEEITGWLEVEARGKLFNDIIKLTNEDTGGTVKDPISLVLRTGKVVGLANQTVLLNKKGDNIPIADSAAPIKNEKGQTFGVIMVFRDISKEKEHREEILYLSHHDHLTGLYNRRFMEEEFKRLNATCQFPQTVIMGDVNGLKLYNDVFGHKSGDKLLQKVAEVIKGNCRQEDIIARWGGDEFLILLPQTTSETAEKVIERIKFSCNKKSARKMQLSVSFGVATKINDEKNLLQVVKEAEEWMCHYKLLEGKSYRNTIINTLLSTLAEKSMETHGHADRLKDYTLEIARELKLTATEQNELELLSVLHDIGKVGININILQKPGPLTPEEWDEMKKHCDIGYRIAQNTPELATVAEDILYHHEWWNGGGYPRGLKEGQIPLLCRILAVADAYDAMTNDRVYRKGMSSEKAIAEIKRNSGTQFDPGIVDIFAKAIANKTSFMLVRSIR